MQHTDFVHDQLQKLKIFSYGQPKGKGKNTDKGNRAHTMLETLNALQGEPQWADLNMRCKLISRPPCPVFIFGVGHVRVVSLVGLKCA